MGKGTGFGKTILIGDQFVLEEVPAIVSAISYETETTVERLAAGDGWVLEDNRIEVPGYKKKKRSNRYNQLIEFSKSWELTSRRIQSRSPSEETCWQGAAWAPARPVVFRSRGR